jgi:hypothetical protein
MAWLKKSTTVTIRLGPFLDKTDGVTEKTGLTPTVTISKGHAAFGARNSATAVTHDANGWYAVELDATDTGTIGKLIAKSNDSTTYLPVWAEFDVIPALVYDALVGGTDTLPVDVTQIDGAATSGNNATLYLKALDIQNSTGTAVVMKSTGSNGIGLDVAGNGTGAGIKAAGGDTGVGVNAVGGGTSGAGLFAQATSGHGADFLGGTSGYGMRVTGGNTNGYGLVVGGKGTGSGVYIESGNGATGNALQLYTQSTDGHGLLIQASGAGQGVYTIGGATSGSGIYAKGGGTGSGMTLASGYGATGFTSEAMALDTASLRLVVRVVDPAGL